MRRVDRERSKHAEHIRHEVLIKCLLILRPERFVRNDFNSVLGELRKYVIAQATNLRLHQRQHTLADDFQLLNRSQFARHRRKVFDVQHLLQTGDAHHKEFIQVTVEDGQKLQTFQQRQRLVCRFFKHPPKELQLA
jgi:hypothetical protein